jgi:transcriptional regulator with XRE-family HTH domain
MAKVMMLELLGANVRTRRVALLLSQEQLADKAGIHPTYLSGIERGIRNPTIASIATIAKALNCSVSELCTGIEGIPRNLNHRHR